MSIVRFNSESLVDELLYMLEDDVFGRFALNMTHSTQLSEVQIIEYFVDDKLIEITSKLEKQIRNELCKDFKNLLAQSVEAVITIQTKTDEEKNDD